MPERIEPRVRTLVAPKASAGNQSLHEIYWDGFASAKPAGRARQQRLLCPAPPRPTHARANRRSGRPRHRQPTTRLQRPASTRQRPRQWRISCAFRRCLAHEGRCVWLGGGLNAAAAISGLPMPAEVIGIADNSRTEEQVEIDRAATQMAVMGCARRCLLPCRPGAVGGSRHWRERWSRSARQVR
jgi:hypothetical protein